MKYTKMPELTEELQGLLKGVNDDVKRSEIITSFLQKYIKYTLVVNFKTGIVQKIESENKVYEEAVKYWIKNKFVVVCPDGAGNELLYSRKTGKFHDFFHEEDWGDNYKIWLRSGIVYNDFMKNLRETVITDD